LGLGNHLWANFRPEAVDRIVEHASQQSLFNARVSDVKAEKEVRIVKEEEANWGHGNGNEVGVTRMQRSSLIEWLQVGGLAHDDRKAMELQRKDFLSRSMKKKRRIFQRRE
jgi:hypothetical protein